MYIVEIAALSKNIPSGRVSFWSKKPQIVGSVISITIAKRIVIGVIIESAPLSTKKQQLRIGNYTLKEFPEPTLHGVLPSHVIPSLAQCARMCLVTSEDLVRTIFSVTIVDAFTVSFPTDVHVFPTKSQARVFAKSHPDVCAISIDNPLAAFFAESLEIHDADNKRYYSHASPHISRAWIISNIAHRNGVPITLQSRIPLPGHSSTIHYEYPPTISYGSPNEFLSDQINATKHHTRELLSQGKRVLWWYERSVFASSVYCSYCQTPVSCSHCSLPAKIITSNYRNILDCNHCKTQDIHVPVVCSTCTKPLIITTQGIDAMRAELEQDLLAVEIVTSKNLEQVLSKQQFDAVCIPLLYSQLTRPHFSTLQSVANNLALCAQYAPIHVHQSAQLLLSEQPLLADYELRKQLQLPPFGSYLRIMVRVINSKLPQLQTALQGIKTPTSHPLVKGATYTTWTLDSDIKHITYQGMPCDENTLVNLLYSLKKIGTMTGMIYPQTSNNDLPFF
jgi:hypothetical protein